jgi:hypothetical protein
MGIKKFIKRVQRTLGVNSYVIENKKKSLKDLLKKLNERKKIIKKSLKKPLDSKEEKELNEELDIVCLQMKKGKKMLHKLYTEKNKQKTQ